MDYVIAGDLYPSGLKYQPVHTREFCMTDRNEDRTNRLERAEHCINLAAGYILVFAAAGLLFCRPCRNGHQYHGGPIHSGHWQPLTLTQSPLPLT
jgi:hypothetical protein